MLAVVSLQWVGVESFDLGKHFPIFKLLPISLVPWLLRLDCWLLDLISSHRSISACVCVCVFVLVFVFMFVFECSFRVALTSIGIENVFDMPEGHVVHMPIFQANTRGDVQGGFPMWRHILRHAGFPVFPNPRIPSRCPYAASFETLFPPTAPSQPPSQPSSPSNLSQPHQDPLGMLDPIADLRSYVFQPENKMRETKDECVI